MSIESITAIATTIINGGVMLAVWKLLGEYKDYNKVTSWKNVKEHYEEIKIPDAIAKAQKELNDKISKQIDDGPQPRFEQMYQQLKESLAFSSYMLTISFNEEGAKEIVKELMPNCEQYFVNTWAWFEQQKHEKPKNP